jgi:hypothetical protein
MGADALVLEGADVMAAEVIGEEGGVAALDAIAQRLVTEGHAVASGNATITAQVVEDAAGERFIQGVVTGNDRDIAIGLERGDDIGFKLEELADDLGVKFEWERGGHYPDLHSEGLHQMIQESEGWIPLGPTYINRGACSAQCSAAQKAINAIVLEIAPLF